MHCVLEGIVSNGRIASAYLFVGSPGSAKNKDASEFARRLECAAIDRIIIAPDGASIKIDQIIEAQQMVKYGPSSGSRMVVIVERADELTAEAAAAFLKTLEEPPPKVTFILLVERKDKVPLTIVSRCQKILFGEDPAGWHPKADFQSWCEEFRGIRRKNELELLNFSGRLEKEKSRIEELIYELIFCARYEMKDFLLVRIFMEAYKNIKKRANLKLTLDVACLKAGDI